MKRDVYTGLLAWKAAPRRKPLVLTGARQVGKTWLLKEFAGREYVESHYLNFEADPRLDELFSDRLTPDAVIRNLSLYLGCEISEDALLILDEIQVSNNALNALKYFAEETPHRHVAAAGSLLGLRLSGSKSFPVGKVRLFDLHPMSFLEFLEAHGETGLRELIESVPELSPIPGPIHDKLVGLLKNYYFVGGMPEAVRTHAESGDLEAVRAVQHDIVRAYSLDFAKYAPPRESPKLSLVWESIPSHLARENKKFMFSTVRKGARAREYEDALTWLADAGLVHKVFCVSTPGLPLRGYARTNVFKIYALDVGLFCAMTRLPSSVLIDGARLFEEFHGALVENYVVQQLAHAGHEALYYWKSEKSQAEVDLVCERGGNLFPLEVKAGINPRSKSLRSFDERFAPPALSRTNLLNMKADGRTRNYPLYAVSRFPTLSSD